MWNIKYFIFVQNDWVVHSNTTSINVRSPLYSNQEILSWRQVQSRVHEEFIVGVQRKHLGVVGAKYCPFLDECVTFKKSSGLLQSSPKKI